MSNLRTAVNWQSPSTATSLITYHGKTAIESLCTCAYMVSSIGSIVAGVTDWSDDLTGVPGYPGVTFKHTTGMRASKVEHPERADASNLEIDVFISAAALTKADIQAGKWDHGACRIFTTNALALHMGQMIEVDGHFSEFTQIGPIYRTQLLGKNDALKQVIGRVTEPACDANVYDSRCYLNAAAPAEIHTVTLSAVTSQTVFR